MPVPPRESPLSSKRPLPEPKPPTIKAQKGKKKVNAVHSFRKKDIYIKDSVSSEDEEKVPFSQSQGVMGLQRAASENSIFELDGLHVYDYPDLAEEVKKKTKKFKFKKGEPEEASSVAAPTNGRDEPIQHEDPQYQNLPLQKLPPPEQSPDLPPPLLPHNLPPPSFAPPSLPPHSFAPPTSQSDTSSSSLENTSQFPSPSQQRLAKKALPVPPTKPKATTLIRIQMESSQNVGHMAAMRARSNPNRPANHEQMSELSALLMSRSTAGGGKGGEAGIPLTPPKTRLKKIPPAGGMKYI